MKKPSLIIAIFSAIFIIQLVYAHKFYLRYFGFDCCCDKSSSQAVISNNKNIQANSTAKLDDTVKVNYIGKLEDGKIFDESKLHGKPLEFKIGGKKLLPEFEDAIIGMKVGEKKEVNIKAENAYGEHKKELIQQVPRAQLPADLKPKVGQKLHAKSENGNVVIATIVNVKDDEITIDINHPLASKDLIFELELVEIV